MTTLYTAILQFTRPQAEIAARQPAHNAWLKEKLAEGSLLLAGPQTSHTGGVMLIRAESTETADALLKTDPFQQENLAEVNIIPFEAALCTPALADVLRH